LLDYARNKNTNVKIVIKSAVISTFTIHNYKKMGKVDGNEKQANYQPFFHHLIHWFFRNGAKCRSLTYRTCGK